MTTSPARASIPTRQADVAAAFAKGAIAPITLGVGLVLGEASNIYGSIDIALRPIVLTAIAALLFYVICAILVRRVWLASLTTTATMAALLGLGPVVLLVTSLLLASILLRQMQSRPQRIGGPTLAVGATRIAALVLLIGFVRVMTTGPVWLSDRALQRESDSTGPPIYLIVADAYARQDTLAGEFGYDNEPFLRSLEDRGFDLYRDAESNYNNTLVALASMFNARPIHELGLPGSTTMSQDFRVLHRSINEAPLWDELGAAGYRLRAVPSMWDGTNIGHAEDTVSGNLTSFDVHLLQSTALGDIVEWVAPDWIAQQHRNQTVGAFNALREPAPPGTFVFAHLMVPHPPFVFESDGSSRPLPSCFPTTCSLWKSWPGVFDDPEAYISGYVPQLEYTNTQLLRVADALPEDAVVVLMGDHGSRFSADVSEHFRILLAVRTPDHPIFLGERPRPLSWFPQLLNTYLATEMQESDAGQWASVGGRPLDLVPIDP